MGGHRRTKKLLLKLTTDHNVWEVYCEHVGESVYTDHRPTPEEIDELRKRNWPDTCWRKDPPPIRVFKLKHFYKRI